MTYLPQVYNHLFHATSFRATLKGKHIEYACSVFKRQLACCTKNMLNDLEQYSFSTRSRIQWLIQRRNDRCSKQEIGMDGAYSRGDIRPSRFEQSTSWFFILQ